MPGSQQHFARLIEPCLDDLFRAAYRLTRSRHDAEDLVQETCVRAFVQLSALREGAPVKPWLLRVMHNLFIDGIRRADRSPLMPHADVTQLAETAPCPAPNPEESLHNAQRAAQIERAWQRLDRGHRALLALRAEGCTLAEISTITHIAMDALTMRLYRARQSLTRCLREEQERPAPAIMEAAK